MGRRIRRVNSQTFMMRLITGYKIGQCTDEMLQWINENVQPYQFYSIEGHDSTSGMSIVAEIIVYEEE